MNYYLFAAAGGQFTPLLMIVAMMAVFYFIAMRPQQKEQKRKESMLASMEVGDTALTTSGFYGVVIDIQNDVVIVEFGSNRNCRIPMQKAAIVAIEKPADSVSGAGLEEAKPEKKGLFGKKSDNKE